jgi:hypothetical protein
MHTGGYDLIIKKNSISTNAKIIKTSRDLWAFSEDILKKQRETGEMEKDCLNIIVLKSLQLNKLYKDLVNKQYDTSIHLRIESDWVEYNEVKKVQQNETLLIDLDKFIDMYNSTLFSKNNVFFTSGENQGHIQNRLHEMGITSTYFFNTELEYELNAAINFEICCQSKVFIGISRSTYSNCITLRRSLLGNDENYIYNLDNKIYKRIDKGLQCDAKKSIGKITQITELAISR